MNEEKLDNPVFLKNLSDDLQRFDNIYNEAIIVAILLFYINLIFLESTYIVN